jgi:hypothetical protein
MTAQVSIGFIGIERSGSVDAETALTLLIENVENTQMHHDMMIMF